MGDKKIPEGWKKVKLGEVADVRDGTHDSPKPQKNGKYLITSRYIKNGKINFDSAYKISIEDYNKINQRSKVDKFDVLFSMIGTVGEMTIVDFEPDFAIKNVGLFKTNNNELLAKWIYYYFKSDIAKAEINALLKGSTQQYITLGDLRSFPILIPPLPEQKAIAEVLSSIDEKIDLLHRQNKTLEKMAETLFREWFIEKAEDDWEEVKLGEVLKNIESGSRPKGGIDPNLKTGIPSIGAENINGLGDFDFSKVKYIPYEYFYRMKRGVVKDYDVLIYKDGAYIGKKSMFGKGFPFEKLCINEHVFILRVNDRLSQFFLYFLLNEEELRNLNTNSAQPGLNQATIKNFSIILPPKNLVTKFDNLVKPWIDKIFFNGIQIRTLEKLRDTLLPKLMSGEVRVKI